MKANLKKRLAKVNDKLSRNGFSTITEGEAITFNQEFKPQSGQDGGCKLISYYGHDGHLLFNRKELNQIGDTLIEISRTYSGVDIY
tara:strand:- start:423 stop:680 length:258 start_codon:yes stop_codon:yes gene_type:complete